MKSSSPSQSLTLRFLSSSPKQFNPLKSSKRVQPSVSRPVKQESNRLQQLQLTASHLRSQLRKRQEGTSLPMLRQMSLRKTMSSRLTAMTRLRTALTLILTIQRMNTPARKMKASSISRPTRSGMKSTVMRLNSR